MVPEPELEHDERPEAVAVLAAACDVVGDQGTNGVGAEESPIEARSVEQNGAELVFQLVLEPAADGDTEAHLAAGPDRFRQQVGEGLLEHNLGAARAKPELSVQRHRGGQIDDPVIQERSPALETMSHARQVNLDQEITGKIGQEIAHHRLGDLVAAASLGPRLGQQRCRVGRSLTGLE